MPNKLSVEERFWSKVNKTDDCWNWTAGIDSDGYGSFWYNKKQVRAPRMSYQLYIGKIDNGKIVCHSCDNPSCVKPEHLFLGTHQDNMTDKVTKKRHSYGIKHKKSKLSEQDILDIRNMKLQGMLQNDIALKYNVNKSCISKIISRITWRHI